MTEKLWNKRSSILRTNEQFYDEVIEDYLHFEFKILFIQSNEIFFKWIKTEKKSEMK